MKKQKCIKKSYHKQKFCFVYVIKFLGKSTQYITFTVSIKKELENVSWFIAIQFKGTDCKKNYEKEFNKD